MESNPKPDCQGCGKRWGKSRAGDNPLVFECLCVHCRECAKAAEAKQFLLVKQTKKTNLFPHLATVEDDNAQPSGAGTAAVLCDNCEEEAATKYCGECAKKQCDACFIFLHKSSKKKQHVAIAVQEYLRRTSSSSSSSSSTAAAGGTDTGVVRAATPLFKARPTCAKHVGQPLQYYCTVCKIAVCADCAVLEHNGHTVQPQALATAVASAEATRGSAKKEAGKLRAAKAMLQDQKSEALQRLNIGFGKVYIISLVLGSYSGVFN